VTLAIIGLDIMLQNSNGSNSGIIVGFKVVKSSNLNYRLEAADIEHIMEVSDVEIFRPGFALPTVSQKLQTYY
jgi:hypothetical protein